MGRITNIFDAYIVWKHKTYILFQNMLQLIET